tara:strand:- start:270 stop:407 length:138 start_codon:yes stop_codon:yes gene_type:complete
MPEDETTIKKEEARQGQRIMGMPTTLAIGVILALVGMLILLAVFR